MCVTGLRVRSSAAWDEVTTVDDAVTTVVDVVTQAKNRLTPARRHARVTVAVGAMAAGTGVDRCWLWQAMVPEAKELQCLFAKKKVEFIKNKTNKNKRG